MEASPQDAPADEVQLRLVHALDLCRQICGGASREPSSAGGSSPRVPPLLRTVSSASSSFSSQSAPPDSIRVHKTQCRKVISRVHHLLPVLERLTSSVPSVASDSRAPFVIFRLEEELRDLLSLLTDCSKKPAPLTSLLSSRRRRELHDKLEGCLQEIRQCHTECLILLGSNGRGPQSDSLFPDSPRHKNPESSIPSSPMVDRSPRVISGFARPSNPAPGHRFSRSVSDASSGPIPVSASADASAAPPPAPRSSSPAPALQNTRPLVPRDPFVCLNPSTSSPPNACAPLSGQSSVGHAHLQPARSQSQSQHQRQQQQQPEGLAGASPIAALSPAVSLTPAQPRGQVQVQGQGQGVQDEEGVRQLVSLLSLGSLAEKTEAVQALLRISEATDGGKLQVAAAGAIPALSVMLALDNEQMKLAAAGVLLHLSWLDENRIVIAKAGCVPSLVRLLRSGHPESRTLAARVLWNLAINVDNKVIIAATEAIPSLVAIIQSDTEPAAKQEAAEALVQLTANNPNNQKAVAEAGAIPSLVTMMREGGPPEQDKAAFALGMLAVNNDENKLTIAGSGAAPLLLDLIQSPDPVVAKSSSWALYVLSSHSISAAYIVASGGIPAVTAALKTGPPEAKYWAAYILSLLDPGCGPPEKSVTLRYSSMPNARAPQDEDPQVLLQRREKRERIFAR